MVVKDAKFQVLLVDDENGSRFGTASQLVNCGPCGVGLKFSSEVSINHALASMTTPSPTSIVEDDTANHEGERTQIKTQGGLTAWGR